MKSGVVGIVVYNGDFFFLEIWGRKEKKEVREKFFFIFGFDIDFDFFYLEISDLLFFFLWRSLKV